MSLPTPNCSFRIPSIHDDVELDCRIYYPRRTERNCQIFGKGFALFAHPYAPLGGCFDDPIVGLVGNIFLRYGFVLATFNFRGAPDSAGRTSWTGKPELSDYVSVYGLLLCYIESIFRSPARGKLGESPILVLGGYSYGSMIAAHLPPTGVVSDIFHAPAEDSAEKEIRLRAEDLARDFRAYLDMHSVQMTLAVPTAGGSDAAADPNKRPSRSVLMGGYDSEATSRRVSRENSRRSIDGERIRQSIDRVRRKVGSRPSTPLMSATASPSTEQSPTLPKVAYVLVSPILAAAAGLTTLFSKLRFTHKNLESSNLSHRLDFEELTTHPCLCVYGSKDTFTSARKLHRWASELQSRPGSDFTAVSAEAGHFWRENEGMLRLHQALAAFLTGLAPKNSGSGSKGTGNDNAEAGTDSPVPQATKEETAESEAAPREH